MMTTYFWMLCEGVFLWVLLARSLGQGEESLVRLCLLGWVGPLLVLLPYVTYRTNYENDRCWMDPGYSVIFLSIPAIIVIKHCIMIIILLILIGLFKTKHLSDIGIDSESTVLSISGLAMGNGWIK